jgi:vacuolar-type H+-ATPase subunit H
MYAQTSPGVYKLVPVTANPTTPVAPTTQAPPTGTATPASPAPATPQPTAPAITPSPAPTQPSTSTGQYYYTKANGANGQPVITYYDSNGNVLPTNPIGGDVYKNTPESTPNSAGKLVQLPSAPTEGGFTQTPQTFDQLNTQIQGQTSNYTAQLDSLNQQSDSAFTQYQTQLQQIENGTFPLTQAQQSILDTTKAQFDQLRQQQVIANQTYTQGLTTFEMRSGEGAGGVTTALGNIQNAINIGVAKLSALDTQAAQTLANLQQGFQSDDLKMITSAYDEWQKYAGQKQNALKEIQDATTQAEKDLRDFTIKQTQQQFDNNLASDKFSLDKANAIVDQALKNAQITKTEADTMLAKAQARQINDQINGAGITNNTAPAVTMTGNNVPDKAMQAAYLAKLPGGANGDLATLVKGIANYNINPNAIPTRQFRGASGYTQQQILTLVAQYDPSFAEQQYASRQALITNFTSGKYSQNINALNTAVGHISDILGNFSGLGNAGFTPYNQAKNFVATIFGSGAPTRAGLNVNAATSEIASVFKGSGATDQEIKALGTLDANSSPDQVEAYIETATQLLASRLNALQDTYSSGMGKAPDKSFLSTTSQHELLNLQQQGLDIKVPQLADSPIVKLQTFYSADPTHASLIDQLVQADPTLKNDPQKMIDLLDQNGINL